MTVTLFKLAALLDVVERFVTATFYLLDNSETSGPVDDPVITVWKPDFDAVSSLLDQCEALPSGSTEHMTAGALLVANLHAAVVAERDALAARVKEVEAERDRYLRHLTAGAESLNKYKHRAEAAEAQVAQVAGIVTPYEPGSFVGDIWFGHPIKTTLGTHRWDGVEWQLMPSETDCLLELLAASRAQVAKLVEDAAFIQEQRASAMLRRNLNAPEDAHVQTLCERYGYGAVMDAASRLWAREDSVGAFYIGGCIGMKTDAEARAALSNVRQEGGE